MTTGDAKSETSGETASETTSEADASSELFTVDRDREASSIYSTTTARSRLSPARPRRSSSTCRRWRRTPPSRIAARTTSF